MDLILLACCNTKTSGGNPIYRNSSIGEHLPLSAYNKLFQARKTLARLKNLDPGPDLGEDPSSAPLLFMPAYARYAGVVFSQSDFATLFPRARNKKVIIVSALYGILEADDSIRDYQATMKDKVGESLLRTWWKAHGLGQILEDYIRKLQPQRVYDLLSNDYRLALEPWPPVNYRYQNLEYVKYEFPGEGIGSLRHRGDKLKTILMGYI